MSRNGAYDIN